MPYLQSINGAINTKQWGLAKNLIEQSEVSDLILSSADVNNSTLLHIIAYSGRLDLIQVLLSRVQQNVSSQQFSEFINQENKFGATALQYSVQQKEEAITQCLLNFGVRADIGNTLNPGTPIKCALEIGLPGMIELLVQYSPAAVLTTAAALGNKDIVNRLLDRDDKHLLIRHSDPQRKNALFYAASRGDNEMVKRLLQAGADVQEALRAAVAYHSLTAIECLLAQAPERVKESASSALFCLRSDFPKMIECFAIAGINIDPIDPERGSSPLTMAAEYNYLKTAERLLFHKANPNTQLTDGRASLHFAAQFGHTEMIDLLCQRGASVYLTTKYENTPLHIAVLTGHREAAKRLLFYDADPNKQNIYKTAPLQMAADRNDPEMVKLLFQYGAKLNITREKEGGNVLFHALTRGAIDIVRVILDCCQINLDSVEMPDLSPLSIAASMGNVPMMELLFQRGATPNNVMSANGPESLCLAVRSGVVSAVELLFARGVSKEWLISRDLGNFSLIVDVIIGKTSPNQKKEMIHFLIRQGTIVNHLFFWEGLLFTPLTYALKEKMDPEIVETIFRGGIEEMARLTSNYCVLDEARRGVIFKGIFFRDVILCFWGNCQNAMTMDWPELYSPFTLANLLVFSIIIKGSAAPVLYPSDLLSLLEFFSERTFNAEEDEKFIENIRQLIQHLMLAMPVLSVFPQFTRIKQQVLRLISKLPKTEQDDYKNIFPLIGSTATPSPVGEEKERDTTVSSSPVVAGELLQFAVGFYRYVAPLEKPKITAVPDIHTEEIKKMFAFFVEYMSTPKVIDDRLVPIYEFLVKNFARLQFRLMHLYKDRSMLTQVLPSFVSLGERLDAKNISANTRIAIEAIRISLLFFTKNYFSEAISVFDKLEDAVDDPLLNNADSFWINLLFKYIISMGRFHAKNPVFQARLFALAASWVRKVPNDKNSETLKEEIKKSIGSLIKNNKFSGIIYQFRIIGASFEKDMIQAHQELENKDKTRLYELLCKENIFTPGEAEELLFLLQDINTENFSLSNDAMQVIADRFISRSCQLLFESEDSNPRGAMLLSAAYEEILSVRRAKGEVTVVEEYSGHLLKLSPVIHRMQHTGSSEKLPEYEARGKLDSVRPFLLLSIVKHLDKLKASRISLEKLARIAGEILPAIPVLAPVEDSKAQGQLQEVAETVARWRHSAQQTAITGASMRKYKETAEAIKELLAYGEVMGISAKYADVALNLLGNFPALLENAETVSRAAVDKIIEFQQIYVEFIVKVHRTSSVSLFSNLVKQCVEILISQIDEKNDSTKTIKRNKKILSCAKNLLDLLRNEDSDTHVLREKVKKLESINEEDEIIRKYLSDDSLSLENLIEILVTHIFPLLRLTSDRDDPEETKRNTDRLEKKLLSLRFSAISEADIRCLLNLSKIYSYCSAFLSSLDTMRGFLLQELIGMVRRVSPERNIPGIEKMTEPLMASLAECYLSKFTSKSPESAYILLQTMCAVDSLTGIFAEEIVRTLILFFKKMTLLKNEILALNALNLLRTMPCQNPAIAEVIVTEVIRLDIQVSSVRSVVALLPKDIQKRLEDAAASMFPWEELRLADFLQTVFALWKKSAPEKQRIYNLFPERARKYPLQRQIQSGDAAVKRGDLRSAMGWYLAAACQHHPHIEASLWLFLSQRKCYYEKRFEKMGVSLFEEKREYNKLRRLETEMRLSEEEKDRQLQELEELRKMKRLEQSKYSPSS